MRIHPDYRLRRTSCVEIGAKGKTATIGDDSGHDVSYERTNMALESGSTGSSLGPRGPTRLLTPFSSTSRARSNRSLVAISSFRFQYTTEDGRIADHHLGVAHIETSVNRPERNSLELELTSFLLRDASTGGGEIDDYYEGFVDVQLLVETGLIPPIAR